MRLYTAAGSIIALATSFASAPAEALTATVNCSQGQKISTAVAAGFDDIKVRGTCTERVEILVDDVTIEGKSGAKVIGQLFVNGAHRITIKNLAVEGAAPTPSGAGIQLDRGAAAVLDHVTVRSAEFGVVAIGNSYVEVLNGSLFENNIGDGVFVELGTGALVKDSTSRNNGDAGVTVRRGANVELVHNSIVNNVFFQVFTTEGGTVRLQGNTLTAAGDNGGLAVWGNATARLRGGNTITAQASAPALHIQRAGIFIQAAGHDIVNGPIGMASLGNADIEDAMINGDVTIDDHSVVTLRSNSTTVNGNIGLARDSGLSLEGPVIINGSVTCDGDESRLYSAEGIITGGVSDCPGFQANQP
jgi:Right handed beta helix region